MSASEVDALDYLRSHSSSECLRIEQERIVFDDAVELLRRV
ncbi:Wadjet anti-phage system protein JetD domain-containing protein [Corynebacterium imitans]|nr:Wadjet anti-phage system protein JetD domain-containing protein [Corynebacterium imitans]